MAKIVVSNLLGEQGSLSDYYHSDTMYRDKGSSSKAIYTDETTMAHVVLSGSGFEYDTHGVLTDGEVTKINLQNSANGSLVTVTQATFNAAKIIDALLDGGIEKAMQVALRKADNFVGSDNGDVLGGYGGNDLMRGQGGNDVLIGGKGNDTLDGGTGSDIFIFNKGDGHDTIRDFDADGGGLKQDYIGADFDNVLKIKQDGHDVIVEFKGGDDITLLHAVKSHITEADFHMPL